MAVFCNPLNLPYRYQFTKQSVQGREEPHFHINREAADPSMIAFKGKYYMFPSMTAGFYTSEDLCHWDFHEFLNEMPVCDYAPDVRKIGDYLYFCASRRGQICDFYRSKDPVTEPFEVIPGSFAFWDPDMFLDDDGKLYFYWGCTNTDPIWGVEMDPETMTPKTAPIPMFDSDTVHRGYERNGENHVPPKSQAEIDATVARMLPMVKAQPELARNMLHMPEGMDPETFLRRMFGNRPYIEGPWMNKYNGKYCLQYAIPGTQYNTYGDGVYEADHPLGPWTPAKNNPYSYVPGGFITGAGHGSTLMEGDRGWHISTMRISKNHDFERRLGMWKAGFDADGELWCDQNYADWPIHMEAPAFRDPQWMLLSKGKTVTVSSGDNAQAVTDEDIRTWWTASDDAPGHWVTVDLGKEMDVRAIQVNFADENVGAEPPADQQPWVGSHEIRYIDMHTYPTRWLLESSLDGEQWQTLEDKREANTDLPHDLVVKEGGVPARYIRLTVERLPYKQIPKVSGLRVFGRGEGEKPGQVTEVSAETLSPMDVRLRWQDTGAAGYNVKFGHGEDKLYHSVLVYGNEVTIGAFVEGQEKYIRVDAFNESGITHGTVRKV